jgi:RHS repeat-associated protein
VWHNGGEYVEFDYMYQSGKNRLDMIVDWANQEVYDFDWDPNGNMTSLEAQYGNTLYNITGTSYSRRNQPLSITKGGSTTYNYRYDHQGHRVYKQEGSNIHYLRGAYGEVLAVYSGGSLTHWNIVRPDGTVIGRRESGGTRKYYHRDHLGSTRAVVTSGGSVTEVYDYMPFGDMMDGRITTSSGGANEKFTGHEFDDEVNLYYMQWRRYIPRFGVFTSVDPMAEAYPGWTPYHYVLNNPITNIDPTGQYVVKANKVTRVLMSQARTAQLMRFAPGLSQGVLIGTYLRGDPSFQNSTVDKVTFGFGQAVKLGRSFMLGVKGIRASEIGVLNVTSMIFGDGIPTMISGMNAAIDGALIDDINSLIKDELIFNAAVGLKTPGGNRLGYLNSAGDVYHYTNAAKNEFGDLIELNVRGYFGRLDQVVSNFTLKNSDLTNRHNQWLLRQLLREEVNRINEENKENEQ